MNIRYGLVAGLLVLGLAMGCDAADTDTETQPFPGVRYVHRHVSSPREIDMHIVLIDLNRPGVVITTTGPNDDRSGETDLETTRAFVKRSQAQIGINSGFFGRMAEEQRPGGGLISVHWPCPTASTSPTGERGSKTPSILAATTRSPS